MIALLIGVQTVAVVTASSYIVKYFRPKQPKLKAYQSNGYTYYKTF